MRPLRLLSPHADLGEWHVRRRQDAGRSRVAATTCLRRLRSRFERSSWAIDQFDARNAILTAESFAAHIDTNGMSITQVADAVAAAAGVTLEPADRNPLRRTWQRGLVRLGHVRLG